jgi:preprotein translocase subunit SecE
VSPSLNSLLPGRKTETSTTKQPAKPAAKSPAKENRFSRWFHETESELRKVVWPTRREWANLTAIVIGVTILMGVFLGAVDFIFQRLILTIR